MKSESGPVNLAICGAIYYTGNLFVSRITSPTGEIWYNDGIETKCQCICEGHLIDFSENSLKFHGSKRCVGVVYSILINYIIIITCGSGPLQCMVVTNLTLLPTF